MINLIQTCENFGYLVCCLSKNAVLDDIWHSLPPVPLRDQNGLHHVFTATGIRSVLTYTSAALRHRFDCAFKACVFQISPINASHACARDHFRTQSTSPAELSPQLNSVMRLVVRPGRMVSRAQPDDSVIVGSQIEPWDLTRRKTSQRQRKTGNVSRYIELVASCCTSCGE